MNIIKRWLRNIIIFFFVSTIGMVVALKYVPVYFTPLMFIRVGEQIADGDEISMKHKWVPLSEISRHAPQAVMASEDNLFLDHNGFDVDAIIQAHKEAQQGKRQRGASTISQQTAKNVFLWPNHSWVRKGFEVYFTFLIEKIWGKERIMEVYLNSIEMGRGIYGIEACSQIKFNRNAANINKKQAALIATTLPNPRQRDSANPTKWMNRRSNKIIQIMGQIKQFPMPEKE
ncbi:MAG: monofunctional biosynthetic peptidoglycan transglycosylase [Muribaculaceae bacterium]|nr:monofunctional biosynthetic peptidoglycan transglycosylase [Muribaculaceae bacterium]